jgi:hypothetical protein
MPPRGLWWGPLDFYPKDGEDHVCDLPFCKSYGDFFRDPTAAAGDRALLPYSLNLI